MAALLVQMKKCGALGRQGRALPASGKSPLYVSSAANQDRKASSPYVHS